MKKALAKYFELIAHSRRSIRARLKTTETILFISAFFLVYSPKIQAQVPKGTIKGQVVAAQTKEELIGVNVILLDTQLGAATGKTGEFVVKNVPVGNYNIAFQYIGFETLIKSDVMVRPGRITYLNTELKSVVVEGEQVVVSAGYFQKEESEPISVVLFNAEEVRRSPGSAGDVSRILLALPSTAQVYDNSNDLMVRGGSPFENGFFVDNIQIPNINHFPSQGSTGGPIGMVNVDFIDDVSFHTGGFSAAYGDRLSSIIDIKFREGNMDEIDSQIDLSMGGFGGVIEGPLPDRKGSWFISGRKSYLDLIVNAIGTGVVPRYGDVQGKLTYRLNPQNKITLLNIFGSSKIKWDPNEADDSGNPAYGEYRCTQNAVGINWRSVWNHKGYSNTSLSYAFIKSDDQWFETSTDDEFSNSNYLEGAVRFRNINFYSFGKKNKIEFGLDGEYDITDYDYFYNSYTNRSGNDVPVFNYQDKFKSWKTGMFVNFVWKPWYRLTTTLGLRGDYFSYNTQYHLSPRFSSTFRVNDRISLNGAFGIFYQNLPLIILFQDEDYKNLRDPMAIHYVLGVDYMLSQNTKLSLEFYNKEYSHFPLEPKDPSLFVIDDGNSMSHFRPYYDLVDKGEAYSRGVELLVQKKLAKDFYGLISASLFKSRYKDYHGMWRDRIYDNQYLFCVIGGYKPNSKWEFSTRWNFSGGVPYTPYDVSKSTAINTGIIDVNRINGERFPNYHSLNIRFDRRFFFQQSNIVVFMSFWNVYNRKNIAMYYWDEVDNEQEAMYQWSFIPIGGIEWEF